ncbi:MAG TPA: GNAT family N-acetyltransferase [Acetobacteraceae bacterium]|nr:GNAT family N-acetyltransferase [Acetobacteraceae bacterium]
MTELAIVCRTSTGTTDITVSGVPDFAALEAKWRDLETRSNASFFQSWTWTGCLVEQRFASPVLVEARENGRTVALALFNRVGEKLYLGESGDPALDDIFIEYNGVLTEAGGEAALTQSCLRAARSSLWRERLVLSGVNTATLMAAQRIGAVRRVRDRPAYFVDFAAGRDAFLQRRSANTRQQLRRSDRDYAKAGAISIERAQTVPQAYAFLDRLAALHQASWVARGQPGAFASPSFGQFHRALIASGLERGEIDLLRVAAGPQTIGFLYNFRYRGESLAYQSGFNHTDAGPHSKPGLTCHHQAIRFGAQWGADRYNFLAGDDRYKRSLADRSENLHWIEVASPYSPRFQMLRLKDYVAGWHRAGSRDGAPSRGGRLPGPEV